ncbi:APC family permease [Mycolicibacterium sp.]|uniref:APC family permease n=1 Tax=Mycolicibacterium sp. TaxID=2320850 RepID=UPI0037CBBC9C|nr:APC family permease [Mycobacterium sp. DSM 3803]
MTPSQELSTAVTPTPNQARLGGNMGVISLVFTVMAFSAPAVAFLGFIPVAIALGNGVGTPVAFLACGVVVALVAVGLTTMARSLPNPGGFYAFISAGLGKTVGLGAGFAAIIIYYVACMSTYALGGIAARSIIADVFHGPALPWWIFAAVLWVIVGVLGYFRIDFSARVLTIFLGLELLLLVSYDVSVLLRGGADGLSLDSFHPASIVSGSVAIAFMFGVGLYGGFEATVIFRDEVRTPERTIPRATYAVVALLAVMYSLTAWLFINAYGPMAVLDVVTADPTAAATASIKEYTGEFAYTMATVLLLTSAFASTLAAHSFATRYAFNLSADKILHHSLSRVHHTQLSPHRASIAISLATFAGLVPLVLARIPDATVYGRLSGVYTYTFLLLLILVALAIPVYLIRHRRAAESVTKPVVASGVAAAILCIALYLATVNFELITGATGVLTVVLLLLIYGIVAAGMVMASIYRRKRPEVYARIGRDDTNLAGTDS